VRRILLEHPVGGQPGEVVIQLADIGSRRRYHTGEGQGGSQERPSIGHDGASLNSAVAQWLTRERIEEIRGGGGDGARTLTRHLQAPGDGSPIGFGALYSCGLIRRKRAHDAVEVIPTVLWGTSKSDNSEGGGGLGAGTEASRPAPSGPHCTQPLAVASDTRGLRALNPDEPSLIEGPPITTMVDVPSVPF
jgi:hypothetical protein